MLGVGVELEQDAVGGEGGRGGDGPLEFAESTVDGFWGSLLVVLLRRRNDEGVLTGDGFSGDFETLGVLALHQEEGDGRGRVAGSPFDGELLAGLEDLIAGWCGEDVEAGDLGEDAGGGGQCQKAGLGE